jgi:hypothetical protein
MDLESTLVRAEALFRRFQRLVETIDKKGNFPTPRPLSSPQPVKLRPEGGASSPTAEEAGASSSSGAGNTAARPPQPAAKGKGPAKKEEEEEELQRKVITPELRALLSRKIEVIPRKTASP